MTNSKGLLALAMGTFALGLAEFSMMGILSPLASGLHIDIEEAGDFISAYALGVSFGSVLPLFFRTTTYKHILLGLSALIFLGNLLTAIAPGYWTLLLARGVAGLPHGAYFGVGAIVAASLAEPGRRATAVAIMVAGMTIANLVGVPCATWLANTASWRLTFVMCAGAGFLTILGIFLFIPNGADRKSTSFAETCKFLENPAPWLIFAAVFLGQGSLYCWYSYMEPIMLNLAHVPPEGMKWVMIIAGLGMFLGGLISGRMADRFPASMVSGAIAVAIMPILAGIHFFSSHMYVEIVLTFLGAAALFGLGGPLQYLIVRFSRGGEILGGAGIQIAFNVSNALAAWLGGLLIGAGFGLSSPALLGIPMAFGCAAILFWFHHRYLKSGSTARRTP